MATEKGLYKYYKDLPGWGKGLVVIGTLGALTAAYFAGRGIYNSIKDKIAAGKAGATVKDATTQLVVLATAGVLPSYADTQYKIWADAMDSCYQGWGTCTGDTIFVNLKNDADILKLIQAFGVRTISSGKWNPEPDFMGDLPGVIRNELSGSDIDSINQSLAEKGITYKF